MFLMEPQPTPGDLHFRIFGTPVRVHPLFWLVAALLGWSYQEIGLQYVLIWILCVFVSIVIHEFGHVWMGQIFGSRGHIVLYSFGGLAIGSKDLADRWKRVAVSAAGPAIQFLPYALAYFAYEYRDKLFGELLDGKARGPIIASLLMLKEINLFWPLLNLLPIWPLDGGQISRELFDYFMPGRGIRIALGISMVVAGALAAHALMVINGAKPLSEYLPAGGWFTVLMFGMLAFSNYQELNQLSASNPWGSDGAPWDR